MRPCDETSLCSVDSLDCAGRILLGFQETLHSIYTLESRAAGWRALESRKANGRSSGESMDTCCACGGITIKLALLGAMKSALP